MSLSVIRTSLLCAAALLATSLARAQGDSAPWLAGFARADITPDRPVWMSGYDSRNKPSEGVECPIFVKALVLQDADGQRAVLVTSDLASVSTAITDHVYEALADET